MIIRFLKYFEHCLSILCFLVLLDSRLKWGLLLFCSFLNQNPHDSIWTLQMTLQLEKFLLHQRISVTFEVLFVINNVQQNQRKPIRFQQELYPTKTNTKLWSQFSQLINKDMDQAAFTMLRLKVGQLNYYNQKFHSYQKWFLVWCNVFKIVLLNYQNHWQIIMHWILNSVF